jgi:hypothetical protein
VATRFLKNMSIPEFNLVILILITRKLQDINIFQNWEWDQKHEYINMKIVLKLMWKIKVSKISLLMFSTYYYYYYGSTALAAFFSFLILYTDGRSLWTGDLPVARPLPTHRTQTQNKCTQYRHPCLEWDSNPWPQRSSKRRQFMP